MRLVQGSYLLFLTALGSFALMSRDLGVHLVAGRSTLQDGIPATNIFSAVNESFPLLQHEWAFQVFSYAIVSMFGLEGLSVVRLLVVLALGIVCWRTAPVESSPVTTAWCVGIGIFVASLRFYWRPELLSLLFLALVLKILVDDALGRRDRLWWLCLVQMCWVNVHGYFIVGLIVTGAFWVGELALSYLRGQDAGRARRIFWAGAAAAACCLVNPYFDEGALYPFRELQGLWSEESRLLTNIEELRPPFPHFANLWSVRAMIPLSILLVVSSVRLRGRVHPGIQLAALACLAMALVALRNIALFGIVGGVIAAVQFGIARANSASAGPVSPGAADVSSGASSLPLRAKGWSIATISVLCLATFLVATNRLYLVQDALRQFGFGAVSYRFDPPAREFIEREIPVAPVLNSFGIGSAYLWWFYPERRPFIDGYGGGYPASFFNQYLHLTDGQGVEDAVERYGLAWALVEIDSPLATKLLEDPAWHPVFLDNRALVTVRRVEAFADVIRKFDLRVDLARGVVPGWQPTPLPSFWNRTLPRAEVELAKFLLPTSPETSASLLAHAVRVAPERTNLRVALGFALLEAKRSAEANAAAREALDMDAEFAGAYGLMASIEEAAGHLGAAVRSAQRGAELAPKEPSGWSRLAELFESANRPSDAVQAWKRVAALLPNNFKAELRLGELCRELGRNREAIEHLQRAVKRAPGRPRANEIRKMIAALERSPSRRVRN